MEDTKPGLVLGKVYLIPTTLGDSAPLEVLPISIKRTIENIDRYIVENEKTARRFIKKVSPSKPQPSLQIETLNKYTDPAVIPSYLDPCIQGHNIGVLSEAGCPGIADPGADVVRVAHERRIQVVPLVGPSSILMAMMASGMNGQNFAFNGYLPIDKMQSVNPRSNTLSDFLRKKANHKFSWKPLTETTNFFRNSLKHFKGPLVCA